MAAVLLPDALWELIETALAGSAEATERWAPARRGPCVPHRRAVCVLRSGIPWQMLPQRAAGLRVWHDLQELLGHADVSTTMIYARVEPWRASREESSRPVIMAFTRVPSASDPHRRTRFLAQIRRQRPCLRAESSQRSATRR